MSSHFTVIYDEWTHNVLKQRSDLKDEDLERTRLLMNTHVRDSLVTGFEHLIPSVELLDLHAAQVCEAAANHRRSLKNPPTAVDEYLDTLLKQGLTQTVGQLREWKVAL